MTSLHELFHYDAFINCNAGGLNGFPDSAECKQIRLVEDMLVRGIEIERIIICEYQGLVE